MNYGKIAEAISAQLQLDNTPIALSFVGTAPIGIETFDGDAPSACSFWRKAESKVFYASAEKHFNCPIGAMTMGFDIPKDVEHELIGLVHEMCDCHYISGEEPEKIPTVKKEKAGIVYGPLKDFPLDPDLILMWLSPRQAMLYNEAVGNIRWTATFPATVFGRPACAALSMAFNRSESTLSLGCMGMRTLTDISEDRLLVVLPGAKAQVFLDTLDSTLAANETMRAFYKEHKARFT